jgi:hypothetical protein
MIELMDSRRSQSGQRKLGVGAIRAGYAPSRGALLPASTPANAHVTRKLNASLSRCSPRSNQGICTRLFLSPRRSKGTSTTSSASSTYWEFLTGAGGAIAMVLGRLAEDQRWRVHKGDRRAGGAPFDGAGGIELPAVSLAVSAS